MIGALIILAALVVVGGVLYLLHKPDEEPKDEPVEAPAEAEGDECCGMHITCERDSLLSAMSSKIEYYDDEELDAYRGREAEGYTDDEIEQFRDVLLTLRPDDIAPWARSIQLRGITLPTEVREELIMIVEEERAKRAVNTQAAS